MNTKIEKIIELIYEEAVEYSNKCKIDITTAIYSVSREIEKGIGKLMEIHNEEKRKNNIRN